MFNPTQADARRFFCRAWRKHRQGEPIEPIEAMVIDVIKAHPEYHDDVADEERAIAANYLVDSGQTNPFLHLSMHLAIAEQLSIDQPPGIRAAYERLSGRLDSAHDALHEIMECLGQIVWESQRRQQTPDSDAYLDCIRRRASS